MANRKKIFKRGLWTLIGVFGLLNVVAIFHSYKFTQFVDEKIDKTKDPKKLTTGQKIATLVFGVNNPRPVNDKIPLTDYETVLLNSNKAIECWNIKAANPKGTIILFHGFGGNKSSMLDKAEVFRGLGYNTFLVDFMGSGGSEGNQTTLGFFEAEQVKTCVDYLTQKGEDTIFLFGTSMGAVAIMKAISDLGVKPKGIILECPFGSFCKTVSARFKTINAPTFPMAGLLVFWGGLQNGFWAFGHNPSDYSMKIDCPALIMYGQKDEKVSKDEIDEIFANLNGRKVLKLYPKAGHENYLIQYKAEWIEDVTHFFESE